MISATAEANLSTIAGASERIAKALEGLLDIYSDRVRAEIARTKPRPRTQPGPELQFGGETRAAKPEPGGHYQDQHNGPIERPTKGEPYFKTGPAAAAPGITGRELNAAHLRGEIQAFRKSEAPHAARYWTETAIRRFAAARGIMLAAMPGKIAGVGK